MSSTTANSTTNTNTTTEKPTTENTTTEKPTTENTQKSEVKKEEDPKKKDDSTTGETSKNKKFDISEKSLQIVFVVLTAFIGLSLIVLAHLDNVGWDFYPRLKVVSCLLTVMAILPVVRAAAFIANTDYQCYMMIGILYAASSLVWIVEKELRGDFSFAPFWGLAINMIAMVLFFVMAGIRRFFSLKAFTATEMFNDYVALKRILYNSFILDAESLVLLFVAGGNIFFKTKNDLLIIVQKFMYPVGGIVAFTYYICIFRKIHNTEKKWETISALVLGVSSYVLILVMTSLRVYSEYLPLEELVKDSLIIGTIAFVLMNTIAKSFLVTLLINKKTVLSDGDKNNSENPAKEKKVDTKPDDAKKGEKKDNEQKEEPANNPVKTPSAEEEKKVNTPIQKKDESSKNVNQVKSQ